MTEFKKPEPLKLTCTAVDCENDLHCFKQLKKMTSDQRGKCRACEADLVDWSRLKQRDLNDAAHTFEALQHELIRHHFFHKEIDEGADRHARRKGRLALFEAVETRLTKYLAPAKPPRDGYQTPLTGNAIYYAQHATATCCRTCLEYWHAIPKGRPLTAEEFGYCQALIELFLDQRLPGLSESPTKVPARRRGVGEAAALL